MTEDVIAVFDIGKTNKKFFLFDMEFKEVLRDYTVFDQIEDEDGYPTENIVALHNWMKATFRQILESKKYNVKAINFSSYGASFVHLDNRGNLVTPLYNYTKPMDGDIISMFFEKYGPEIDFCRDTGTTNSGMLNSGMQLFWLKHRKPDLFSHIKCSLHLPQYLSYVFTGIPISEYTSIGCHTALWDYSKQDYHAWVYNEGIHGILPSIVPAETSINTSYDGKQMKIGVGIHDSSSALLPYVRSIDEKFLLLSTGTWSVALNPFSKSMLSNADIKSNCINYMRINGAPVTASRLFLGNEYNKKVKELAAQFHVSEDYHKNVQFNPVVCQKILGDDKPRFRWDSLGIGAKNVDGNPRFDSYEEAYHQLMHEMVDLQIESIHRAIGNDRISQIYIDGGFANNQIFLELLAMGLGGIKIRTTDASLGSALGAAIAISNVTLDSKFLEKNYALKKHRPLITS